VAGHGAGQPFVGEEPVDRRKSVERRSHSGILPLGRLPPWRRRSILMPMGVVDPVNELSRVLDELSRRWERFFARDPQVRTPPDRERQALERRLREMSRQEAPTAAEDFRVQQLLHRFAAYNSMWQRQLRDREASRHGITASEEEINASRRTPVPPAGDEFEPLHAAYVAALRAAGAAGTVSLARFRESLEGQRRSLEASGAVVEGFDVVQEGSQVKLRARVRRGR
jgi:hypothetical protein